MAKQNNNKFRFDSRTKEEFTKDIKESTDIEAKLMQLYVDDLNKRKGELLYTFSNNGCDNSGEYLTAKKVSTKADFILHKKGSKDRLIEIKFSKPDVSSFHLKIHQLESYVKQDNAIVMFTSIDDDNIRYTVLLPRNYRDYIDKGERKRFWGKDCIRLKTNDFDWCATAPLKDIN